ncbi:MAG: hypothetical protein H8D78_08670 [Chloroflexi bacterium]|nr:hypothetical protein [Chloroflexota bacterium]
MKGRVAGLKPLLIVFLVALVVRGGTAVVLEDPRTWDSIYYYLLAANLAKGRGLVEDVIGHYQDGPEGLPHPAGAIWLPGQALAEAAAMKVFGVSFRGAQVAAVVLAALASALSYRFTWEISGRRRTAALAAIFSLACGSMAANLVDTDCYTLYTVAGGMALYSMYKSMVGWSDGQVVGWSDRARPLVRRATTPSDQGPPDQKTKDQEAIRPGTNGAIWLAGTGLWIGLAHWTRQDAPLLWVVLLCAMVYRRWRIAECGTRNHSAICNPHSAIICSLGLYLIVVAPMYLRNLRVWGKLSPVDPLYAAFLTDYNHFFALEPRTDIARFLAQGWRTILATRWEALRFSALVVFGRAAFQIWQVPFLGLGVWAVRRRRELFPVLIYPLLLWLVLGIVYAFPAVHGTFLHSLSAFLPFGYGLAALGVEEAGRLLGQLKGIRGAPMTRYLQVLTAVTAVLFTAAALLHGWREASQGQEACRWLGEAFSSTPAQVRVMSPNPPAMAYCTGRAGIVVPGEEVAETETVIEAMKRFGVEYLALWGTVKLEPESGTGNPGRLVPFLSFEERGIRIWKLEDEG